MHEDEDGDANADEENRPPTSSCATEQTQLRTPLAFMYATVPKRNTDPGRRYYHEHFPICPDHHVGALRWKFAPVQE